MPAMLFQKSARVRQKARAALWQHGAAILAYLVIALFFTYPTALHMSSAIVGEGPDTLQSYWTMWWTGHALLERGENPFHGALMHHPFGLPLYFHVHNFFNSLLSIPLQVCCGTAFAYNMLVLLTFPLTGAGTYALVWHVTRLRAAAFLGGLICAFNPYMVLHLRVGQPYLLSIGWLALFILALLKIGESAQSEEDRGQAEAVTSRLPPLMRDPWLFLAALFLLLVALTDWHYAIYGVLLAGLLGLCHLYPAARQRNWRGFARVTGRLALVGALFALLFAPILVPALLELAQAERTVARPLWNAVYHSTDLLAYLLPSIFHPLWGAWTSDIFYGRLVTWYIVGGIATTGYLPLLLALGGAVFERRRGMLFVLLLAIFFVLTLGPFLQVNGWNSYRTGEPVPLPYLLLRELPLMNLQRVPSRFFVVVLIAFAVLAGLGVVWLWQRPTIARLPAWGRGLLLAVLAGVVLFEYWPRPFPVTPVGPQQVSPFLRGLADDSADYALLELPYPVNTSSFYQTYHQKPIVGGVISRTPPHPWRGGRFFGPLLDVEPTWQSVGSDDSPAAIRSALRCQGIRYVIFYQQEMQRVADPAYLWQIEQHLFADIEPVYDDAVLRAYEVFNERPAAPYWTLAPGEWYRGDTNAQGITYRWAQGQQGDLLIYPCTAQEGASKQQQAVIQFNMFSFAVPRTIQVSLDGQPAGSFSLPPETVRQVRLLVPLHTGENRLTLRSAEPAMSPAAQGFENDTRQISFNLSQVRVETLERSYIPAALRSASTLSSRSQGSSMSVRPKCP